MKSFQIFLLITNLWLIGSYFMEGWQNAFFLIMGLIYLIFAVGSLSVESKMQQTISKIENLKFKIINTQLDYIKLYLKELKGGKLK